MFLKNISFFSIFFDQKKYNLILIWLSLFFFIFINFIYFYLHLNLKIEVDKYAFSELFINYQAGFIRRGLLGEVAWQLNDLFSVKPIYFFSIFFIFIHLITTLIFFYLFKKYIISKSIFALIFFSPALILFHIYDPNLFYIKDGIIKLTILFHSFIFFFFVIKKKQTNKYFSYLKIFLIPFLFLVILTHEYQVFFLGIHYLISLGAIKNKDDKNKLIKNYLPLILPFILVFIFNGSEEQLGKLNIILSKFDVQLNDYLIGSLYKFVGGSYKWHLYYFTYRDFLYLLLSFILSVVVIYFLFEKLISKKIIKLNSFFQKKYYLYFVPTFLPFLFTADHGREFSLIAFYLIAFYSTLNLQQNKLIIFCKKINDDIGKRLMIFFFLIFYIFMWKLDQFAGFGFKNQTNTMFESSLFAEFVKFIKFLYSYIDLNIINLPEIKL